MFVEKFPKFMELFNAYNMMERNICLTKLLLQDVQLFTVKISGL